MDDSQFDALVERWTNDQSFREALRANPEQAVASLGITLSEDERAALQGLDLANLNDAEMEQRISKTC